MGRTSEESARTMARAVEAAALRELGAAGMDEGGEAPAAHATRLSVSHVNLFYGDHQALKDVCIDIPEREITSFIGPSGCGKSTSLRCFNRMNDYVKGCRIEGSITPSTARTSTRTSAPRCCVSAWAWCSNIPTRSP